MDFLTWILVIILFCIIAATSMFGLWAYFLPQPTPGTAPMPGWSANGDYVVESYYDETIMTPAQQLYLGEFNYNSKLGFPPRCNSTFYAIRYVRPSDGGYSQMGPWTASPIIAGVDVSALPCPPSGCSSKVIGGCSGNKNNQVYIGTPDQLTYDPFSLQGNADPIYANVHRCTCVTKPEDGTDPGSEIIGVLFPSTLYGFQWGMADLVTTNDSGNICSC